MIRRSTPGQHRVADGAVADPRLTTTGSLDPVPPVSAAAGGGPFTIQRLNDQWFIGWPGAAQRIEDPTGLDAWLVANGRTDRSALDFSGDRDLEQRFWTEMDGQPENG